MRLGCLSSQLPRRYHAEIKIPNDRSLGEVPTELPADSSADGATSSLPQSSHPRFPVKPFQRAQKDFVCDQEPQGREAAPALHLQERHPRLQAPSRCCPLRRHVSSGGSEQATRCSGWGLPRAALGRGGERLSFDGPEARRPRPASRTSPDIRPSRIDVHAKAGTQGTIRFPDMCPSTGYAK